MNDNCISQFFQGKPKPTIDTGVKPLRAEKNNSHDIILLDDDSDEDIDSNDIAIVDLTQGTEPVKTLASIGDDAKETADAREKSNSPKCDEDVNDGMTKTKDMIPRHGTEPKSCDEQNDAKAEQDQVLPPDIPPMPVKKKENPFAKFAHGASVGLQSRVNSAVRTTWLQHSNKRPNSCIKNGNSEKNNHRSKKAATCAREKDFVRMKDEPPEKQIKIVRKWHSLADPSASLEQQRYQVLLAARLHARCQEPTVRKAILKLREHFVSVSEAKTITVEDMAKSDPEELAVHISSLQFYNVKAKQIVKAAQEIQSQYGGIVPEDEFSLLQITGIGKTFADLLAFVNTREMFQRISSESVPV